jgi:hypothetical protein
MANADLDVGEMDLDVGTHLKEEEEEVVEVLNPFQSKALVSDYVR